ncbi:uncharacterized protein LOC134184980 [Corticium candelabrum]|uniref:uncharacterized protein LOC134184980 n=1 Tax=Corticium candelabrum TaxID=121492 RepID=UPI002E2FD189|nr:uncharacterized protein LOC134184980 [Corticium candelabrum]
MSNSKDTEVEHDDWNHLAQLARVPSHAEIMSNRRPVVMPTRGGMKDFRTDGSARQRRKLNAFYEASRELFTEEHSVNKKSLSIAEWVPNRGYAEVKIAKGSCWRWIGRSIDGQLTLWPEEALFLLETGHLELYYCGLPLPIQQGFHLLTHGTLTSIEYQVYSMLVRSGLIVYRSEKRKSVMLHSDDSFATESQDQESSINSTKFQSTSEDIQQCSLSSDAKNTFSVGEVDICKGQSSVRKRQRESDETTHLVSKKPRIANICKKGGLIDSLIVTAARGSMLLLAADAAQGDAIAKDSLQQWMGGRLHIRRDLPVVSPLDATSTGSILKKLKIFHNYVSADIPNSLKSRFSISFDVYKHCSKFRKTEPGRPDYHVVVSKSSDPPPFLSEINVINKMANGIPVKWAMVESGNVSFYDFMDLQLPSVVSNG